MRHMDNTDICFMSLGQTCNTDCKMLQRAREYSPEYEAIRSRTLKYVQSSTVLWIIPYINQLAQICLNNANVS